MWRTIFISFGLLFVGVQGLAAHPHVFVDQKLHFISDGNTCIAVELEWLFDSMFSATILEDTHITKKGELSVAEQASIKKTYFDNLKYYNFFTKLSVDGKARKLPTPENFESWLSDGRVGYRFRFPIKPAFGPGKHKVEVLVVDETYFTDFTPLDQMITSVRGPVLEAAHLVFPVRTIDVGSWGKVKVNVPTFSFTTKE